MVSFNKKYINIIEDKNLIQPEKMVRGKFYLIKEYQRVNGINDKYSEKNAPIIFVLFASKKKDIIHAVKLSNVNPNKIKKFFSKLLNEKTEELEIKGSSKSVYKSVVSKSPTITNDAYRTYTMSGIKKVIELDMDIQELI